MDLQSTISLVKEVILGKTKNLNALGVDICPSSVKIVDLYLDDDRIKVRDYVIQELHADCVTNGKVVNHIAVSGALKAAAFGLKSKSGANVCMPLPDSLVTVREMILPSSLDSQSILSQAESEVVQLTGQPIDSLAIDYAIDPDFKEPGKIKVMVAIARKEHIEERTMIIQEIGWKVETMDVDFYATSSVAALFIEKKGIAYDDPKISLFLEIGAEETTFFFFRGQKVVFSKRQVFGGANLTKEIQSELSIALDDAEAGKKKPESLPDDYANKILPNFVADVCSMLVRTSQIFFTTTSYTKIDLVILSGGTAHLPNLKESVKAEINTDVEIIELFSQEDVDPSVDYVEFKKNESRLITALGVAIRNIRS